MSLLDEQLRMAQETGLLVDIYRDYHQDSRLGRVHAVTEFCVYMTCFTDDGEYNGISICRKDHITRIRWGGIDRESLKRLIERNGSVPAAPEINLATLKDIIESVQKEFHYVTVALETLTPDEIYIGEVVSVDHDYLMLNEYGPSDALDRSMLVLDMDEVTLVDADGKYERSILFLHGAI